MLEVGVTTPDPKRGLAINGTSTTIEKEGKSQKRGLMWPALRGLYSRFKFADIILAGK